MNNEERIKDLLKKAKEFLNASQLLLENGYYDSALSRGYYAMFSIARALLLSKGIKTKSHREVLIKFGQEFVKTGIFPKDMADALARGESLREQGDYSPTPNIIPKDKAEEIIKNAREFIEIAERYLEIEGERQRRIKKETERENDEDMEMGA